MTAKHPCTRGPGGTPCGNVRVGESYTRDVCYLCWLGVHTEYRIAWGLEGYPVQPLRNRDGSRARKRLNVPEWDAPPKTVLEYGPGTELAKFLDALGVKKAAGCQCAAFAAQMNEWGVEGCRTHRDVIAQWLRDNAKARGWWEKTKAAVLATIKGSVFQLNPIDPFGSLVDLVIQRAEETSNPPST